ncbi:hypothetical protein JYU34_017015 [Plutella xylostella]|uniref:Uncharacterized protein n=1 Tax=Plutella xylostella TaxID=51655 RepID=A0ABQ7Q414_PLUXY|nr:hypothetical protein JYU34_017015 [Plutella xylostella]
MQIVLSSSRIGFNPRVYCEAADFSEGATAACVLWPCSTARPRHATPRNPRSRVCFRAAMSVPFHIEISHEGAPSGSFLCAERAVIRRLEKCLAAAAAAAGSCGRDLRIVEAIAGV